jgi:sulfur carrier protein
MKVILRYPKREVEVAGNRRVKELLREFDVLPETVLVIRGSELLTADTVVGGDDVIELRPVISGGSAPAPRGARRTEAPRVGGRP